ncbi:MAG: HEAT repeat domain-containing protein [Geobacteraceae bacterium]|jgi:hypothetical protein
MSPSTATKTEPAVERRQATAFVAELIIYRRHIRSYPASHPIVTASLQKTIASFAPLIADSRAFTLGISQNGLLFKNDILGPGIAKFKEFAATLASFGIITISFTAELKPEDLHLFNCITNRPRNEVWESGGIKHALAADGIQAIKVQVIDPSVFSLTDDLTPESPGNAADPWDIFVRKLLDGYFSASPESLLQLIAATPAELGREFGSIIDGIPEEAHHQTIKTLADFFANLAHRQGIEGLHEDALEKITAFIAGIPPRLRRDFIFNICNSSHTMPGFSEELLQRIPGDAFLEAMQSVATHGENIPEMVLKLMQRLSAQSESTPDLDAAISDAGSTEKVRLLLKESAMEEFVPPAYRKTLMAILATDTLPVKSMEALAELQKTLGYHHLEAKTGDIICEIIRQIPAEERGDGIRSNLMALASHYLCNGDFNSLERICRIILDEAYAKQCAAFFDPGFVQEILDAASLLGREKYQDIRSIISTVGQPFVVPLMERLFAEENRSLRRFWFDCLGDLGEMVRNAALERLNDERWFVVRNLIIMLDSFGDQEVQRQVRRLVGHSHPRVRKEALKYLLHYQDPMVDIQLLQDLDSNDPARKLSAVQIAEMSSNPEVLHKLLAILDSGSITGYGLEIKSAVIQALAGIGNAQAVPKLKEILYSGKFLHSGKHTQLKIMIIRSLPRFPAAMVRPLLEEICATGGKTLAPVAAEALKGLQGTVP